MCIKCNNKHQITKVHKIKNRIFMNMLKYVCEFFFFLVLFSQNIQPFNNRLKTTWIAVFPFEKKTDIKKCCLRIWNADALFGTSVAIVIEMCSKFNERMALCDYDAGQGGRAAVARQISFFFIVLKWVVKRFLFANIFIFLNANKVISFYNICFSPAPLFQLEAKKKFIFCAFFLLQQIKGLTWNLCDDCWWSFCKDFRTIL